MVPPSLLVVDDDPVVQRLMARVLEAAGYRVASAETGTDALAAVASDSPALAVLDLSIEPEGGIALARALRADHPGLELLVVSGSPPEPEDGSWLREAGGRFLPKPFGPAAFLEAVREMLGEAG